ncbi:MAG TPA: PAS domain S-box protein, partial [Anaerolineales bacterium]|nr:PAS domain S-box protein [Anaerolineales bacterium]
AVSVWHDVTGQKEAEKALAESRQRINDILGSLGDGLFALNREWSIIYVNQQAAQIAGYSVEELVGKNLWELWPRLRGTSLEAHYRRAMENGIPGQFQVQGSQSDRWYDVSVYPSSEGITIFYVDKTEQILAEERFNKAFHASPNSLVISHQDDGKIETVNETFVRFFGYSEEEVIRKTSVELGMFVNPADRQEAIRMLQRAGSVRDFELDVRLKSGEIRNASLSVEKINIGDKGLILTALQDITLRRQTEQALRESEERFRSLADSMPQLVWTALPDGTVDYYNSRYQEYWKIKQVEETVWEWAPVLHPDDLQSTMDAWQHSVKTRELYQIEHRVRMADGTYRWHLSRGMPLRDEEGRVIRWFGTATDIHDMKMAQEQSKMYAERLERSNRELEQFAFTASHDLQEPLRKIEVFGDLLLESSRSLSGRERNYLDRMRDAAGRMRDMVDGLLQLSRVTTQGKSFVQVDLSQLIAKVLYDLENQIRRTGGKVDVGNLPAIEGDPLQLHQLMQNLIGNALKYHQLDAPPAVNIYAKQLPGKVQIFVEDHGIGFDQADAERIFQPFQRLVGRSQYEGSGIGLAICRRIVERHSGEIAARSTPDRGTTFIVTLPIYQVEAAQKETRKDTPNENSGATPDR